MLRNEVRMDGDSGKLGKLPRGAERHGRHMDGQVK